jgi:AbrB family looped-hinge helix DNA binding protein
MEKCELKIVWVASIWSKGQIVIPKEIREDLGIKSWDSFVVLLKAWKFIGLVRNQDLDEVMAYVKMEEKMKKIRV